MRSIHENYRAAIDHEQACALSRVDIVRLARVLVEADGDGEVLAWRDPARPRVRVVSLSGRTQQGRGQGDAQGGKRRRVAPGRGVGGGSLPCGAATGPD
eukprot:scaffold14737_cov68-Phaeocystis_antarctica.AAC.2